MNEVRKPIDGLRFWSRFLGKPMEELSVVPLGRFGDRVRPSVGGFRMESLDSGEWRYGVLSDSVKSRARAGWGLYLGDLPLVCFDLDEDADVSGEGGYSWFVRLLSDLGVSDVLSRVVLVRTPSGGAHIYFRDPSLGTQTLKEYLHTNYRQGYLRLFPGVEFFSRRVVTCVGTRRGDKVYRLESAPDSVADLAELPSCLVYILTGGLFGVLTDAQRAVLMGSYPELWAWCEARSRELGGVRDRRLLSRRPSRLYLFLWKRGLLRREWLLDFLSEAESKIYGDVTWREGSCDGDYYGRCLFHYEDNPSATLSFVPVSQSDLSYLARASGVESASDSKAVHRLLYRCFVCCPVGGEADRGVSMRQFLSLLFLYGSWLYDKGLISKSDAVRLGAWIAIAGEETVGSDWLVRLPHMSSLSYSLEGTGYLRYASKVLGRPVRVLEAPSVASGLVAKKSSSSGGGNSRKPRSLSFAALKVFAIGKVMPDYCRDKALALIRRFLFSSDSVSSSWLPSDRKARVEFFEGLEGRSLGYIYSLLVQLLRERGMMTDDMERDAARLLEVLEARGDTERFEVSFGGGTTGMEREDSGEVREVAVASGEASEPYDRRKELCRALYRMAHRRRWWFLSLPKGRGLCGGSRERWKRAVRDIYDAVERITEKTLENLLVYAESDSVWVDPRLVPGFGDSGSSAANAESSEASAESSEAAAAESPQSVSVASSIVVRYDGIRDWLRSRRASGADTDDQILGDWLRRGQLVALTGRPGSYKSTLMRFLASSLVSGGTFLGRKARVSRVLYLPFDESSYYFLDRVDPLLMRLDADARSRFHVLFQSPELSDYVSRVHGGDWLAAIFTLASEMGVDVVLVDTLMTLMNLWVSSRRRVSDDGSLSYLFTQELRRYAERFGVAVVMTAHSGKSFERVGDDPSRFVDTSYAILGHTAFAAGCDSVWYTESVSQEGGAYVGRLLTSKCRHAPFDYKYMLDSSALVMFRYQSMRPGGGSGHDLSHFDFTVDYSRVAYRPGVLDIQFPRGVRIDGLVSRGGGNATGAGDVGVGVGSGGSDGDDGGGDDDGGGGGVRFSVLNGGASDGAGLGTNDGVGATGSLDAPVDGDAVSDVGDSLMYARSRVRHGRRYLLSENGEHDDSTVLMLDDSSLPAVRDFPHRVIRSVRALPYDASVGDSDWVIDGYLLKFAVEGYRPFRGESLGSVRRVVFDMECSNIDPKSGEILAIGVRTGSGESFCISGGTELERVRRFDEFLMEYDPEWLVGYNILGFDLPYLEHRCRVLGYTFRWLEENFRKRHIRYRYGSNDEDVTIYVPRARLSLDSYARRGVVDLYLLALRHVSDLESYKLVDVVSHFFGEEAVHRAVADKARMGEWSSDAVDRQVLEDVRMTDLLVEKLVSVDFMLADIVPIPFSLLLYSGQGRRWQDMMLASYLQRGVCVLDVEEQKSSYQGAISECFLTGVFSSVAKVDVASLYPSVIVKYSVAPRADYLGLLPSLVSSMMEQRLRYKRMAKETGDPYYASLQNALKVLINSAYGFLGATGTRFSDMEAAATVTARGRECLTLMMDRLGQVGSVIEVDTDGVLLTYSNRSELELAVSALMDETGYTMEIEYYVSACVLAAKNYALLGEDGSVIVHGASLRSRSSSRYVARLAREFVDRLLAVREESDFDKIMDWLETVARSFRDVDPYDLVERSRVSRRTGERRDVVIEEESPLKVGEYVYVYYERGRAYRVMRRELPDGLELDRVRYLKRFYSFISRFKSVKPFWSRFLSRYGSFERFALVLSGQAELF